MTQPLPLFPSPHRPTSHLRPSLFELLAQEQLRDLLHPVFRYVLSYATQHYPRYLLRVLNRHEEAFALVLLLLERHHLKKHDASLSEHFYQLRLVPNTGIKTPLLDAFEQPLPRKLNTRQRWGLLLFLVGLPYFRARAQDYFERLGGAQDGDEAQAPAMAVTKVQCAFKLLYPYANLALDLTFLGYDLAYLFEKTDAYRPWHRWLGVRVERRGPDDTPPSPSTSLLDRLPPLLPPLLLLLKLSQWWYSPSSPRTLTTATSTSTAALHASILPPRPLAILPNSGILPMTPPPSPPPPDRLGEGENAGPNAATLAKTSGQSYEIGPKEYGKCPLCRRKWQNPAILPSGWVVCWRCGWDAIEGEDEDDEDGGGGEVDEKVGTGEAGTASVRAGETRRRGRCPITGIAVAPGELRRVLV